MKKPNPQVERALEYFDNQTAFAKAIGVCQSMVSQWLRNTRPVSPKKCRLIEAATNGEVTREDLRPDIFADTAA